MNPTHSEPQSSTHIPHINETRFMYDGETGKIFGIWIINLLLSIITIGIYSFWGKTRMRQYIAHSFYILDDRLEYTGTGGELFRGFIKALPVILLIYVPYIVVDNEKHPWINILTIPFFYMIYVATYAALRYRLSRTTWRGIRGRLKGSAWQFGGEKIAHIFLNFMTLGLTIPFSDIVMYRFIVERMYFGDTKLSFDGISKPLFTINLVTLILAIPTLGISRFWYAAALKRHQYHHTMLNGLRFKATHTGGSLMGLHAGNMFILIVTLGLGKAMVIQRNLAYFSDRVRIEGDINTANIRQSDEILGSSGEGLEEVFGLDSGFM